MTLSYHGEHAFKNEVVTLAHGHRALDLLRVGKYDHGNGIGCSVGCFALDYGLRAGDHAVLAEHLGWPQWLVSIQDNIFERLPARERNKWHVDLVEAVPVGVDLDGLYARWVSLTSTVNASFSDASYAFFNGQTSLAEYKAVRHKTGRAHRDELLRLLREAA
jgi:hypothetical protein